MLRCNNAPIVILVVFVALGSFGLGLWFNGRHVAEAGLATPRFQCPMHPSYHSDRPGDCVSCGMRLVRADLATPGRPSHEGVSVTSQQQQLMGVRIGSVEALSGERKIRTLGRVAPDDNRIYRIIAGSDGWILDIFGGTVGSVVAKDALLANFYSKDFRSAQQAYFFALDTLERRRKATAEGDDNLWLTDAQVRSTVETLEYLGMGSIQIEDIRRRRTIAEKVEVRSPVTGLVIARDVAPGLRFNRQSELYRLADLSRVWIIADLFEGDARYVKPGMTAQVVLASQNKAFTARVTDVPPQFDGATRRLKVRLDASNPGFLLRPDMFVDLTFSIHSPEKTLVVPVDAVINAGVRKTVFVDAGDGHFDPRRVETGWQSDGAVEITKGLAAGERVVLSGAFLLDSESRMRASAHKTAHADVVCGMQVDQGEATALGKASVYHGRTYYFCSMSCKSAFEANPVEYVEAPHGGIADVRRKDRGARQ